MDKVAFERGIRCAQTYIDEGDIHSSFQRQSHWQEFMSYDARTPDETVTHTIEKDRATCLIVSSSHREEILYVKYADYYVRIEHFVCDASIEPDGEVLSAMDFVTVYVYQPKFM